MLKQLMITLIISSVGLNAVAAEKGVSNDTILLGQSAPTTGPLGPSLLDYVDGANLYFKHINEGGGIYGRKINLVTMNDEFDPEKTVENTRKLLNDTKVFAIFAPVGNANITKAQPLLKAEKIPVFAPVTGADVLRDDTNRYMFHIRASFDEEISSMVNLLVTTGVTEIGVVYQDDGYGKAVIDSTNKALAKHGLKPVALGAFDIAKMDMSGVTKAIDQGHPKAVILGTSGAGAIKAIKAILETKKNKPQIYALSLVGSQALVKYLGPASYGIVVAQVIPSPWRTTNLVVHEYQQLHKLRGTNNYSYLNLEGFIAAKALVEGLRKTGKNLTRERFVDALESMNNADIGGYYLRFGPPKKNGSSYVDLSIIAQDGRFLM